MKPGFLADAANWVFNKFASPSWWTRGVSLLILVGLVTAFVLFFPWFQTLRERFDELSAQHRGVAFSVTLVVVLLSVIIGIYMTFGKIALQNTSETLAAELEAAQLEAKLANERWDHLLSVESKGKLWQRECVTATPVFVPRDRRKTRFVTVLNLKGGVGKTALAANLAAAFGTDKQPLRVLLVDIDFQGTLGDATVDRPLILLQQQHNGFVGQLLAAKTADPELVMRLAVPMKGVPAAKVILSNDALDTDDFQLQARFFVDPKDDPRFRFRAHLHSQPVLEAFDLVLFDCPPRVTTSVVNALFCSDHVLIPTRMDSGSIDAVPRTVTWLKSLGPLCPADVIGVVASHVRILKGKPVKADQTSYQELGELVKSSGAGGALFRAPVPASPLVAEGANDGEKLFAAVAAELRQRMTK